MTLSGMMMLTMAPLLIAPGPIPATLGDLKELTTLRLDHNKLDGKLKTSLTRMDHIHGASAVRVPRLASSGGLSRYPSRARPNDSAVKPCALLLPTPVQPMVGVYFQSTCNAIVHGHSSSERHGSSAFNSILARLKH